ncbi:NAD(P)H-dependent anabolic L-arginine dehydrogenase DauB [Catenulispora yoronensis]|uniref:NAD(P)H-dependent anabolic L-arginine dehydrogenase DauB n=1 Tax=Catenulispora yoronensis TaxID=450799 RepID=A0ABP5FN56_9ACTN
MVEQVPALDAIAVLDALRSAFTELGRGNAAQPPQTVTLLPGGGDVILYQGQLGATYSVKVSPYLPQTDGSAVVTAWTILLDTATGRPELLVDAAGLTVERTSATSALAVDLLARPDAATLAIIGSGAQARAHLRYARAVREFTDVRMFSRSLTQADAPEGVKVAASAAQAVSGADVVLLCTSAGEALIDAASLPPGTVITSISTNVARAHEIDPAALPALDVYGDYRPTVVRSAGEMVIAAERGDWTAEQLRGDLPELLTGACPPPSGTRPVFFRSIGMGLEDLAIARLILEH